MGRDFPTLVNAIHDLDVDLILKTKQEVEIDRSARSRIRKISERLSFLQLRNLYASCRFVVVPLHETLNVSGVGTVLEAMAMGKALIVSDNPPIRDYIIPDETCLVVPPGDVAALRSAIERLIREPETVRRLGAAGRKLAEARFSHPVHAARLGAAFRLASGVADPSPGRRPGRHDPVEQNP